MSDPIAADVAPHCDALQVAFTVQHIPGEQQNIKRFLAEMRPVRQNPIKLIVSPPETAAATGDAAKRPRTIINAALSPLSYPPLQLQVQQRCKAHELNADTIDTSSITTVAELNQLRAHVAVSCSQQKKGQASRLTDMRNAVQYKPLRYTPKPGKRVSAAQPRAPDAAYSDNWWHEVDALHVTELVNDAAVTEAVQLMYGKASNSLVAAELDMRLCAGHFAY